MSQAEGIEKEGQVKGRALLTRRQVLGGMAFGAGGLVLAACGSSEPSASRKHAKSSSSFPLGAASQSKTKPVEITFWNETQDINQTALSHLTDEFNSSQSDVRVKLVNQTSYTDILTAYRTGLSSGPLPQVVQMKTDFLQLMIDSQSVVPVQEAVDADHESLSDYLPKAIEYFTVDHKLWAMPFSISGQILYYNKHLFEKAGLDPDKPPQTVAELLDAAKTMAAKKVAPYPMAVNVTPSPFKQWLAMGGVPLVNHDNGRSGRATKVNFDDHLGQSLALWYQEMFRGHLGVPEPASGPGGFNNLFALASLTSAMTLETSAALGEVISLIPHYPKVALGIGPIPGPNGTKGVYVGGSGLYIVKAKSTPAQQDAAWRYIKHLMSPSSQAYWAALTGYVPTRLSAAKLPLLKDRWEKYPELKVAYDQILASPNTIANAGTLLGPFEEVNLDIVNALTLIGQGKPALSTLAKAAKSADESIARYNARI